MPALWRHVLLILLVMAGGGASAMPACGSDEACLESGSKVYLQRCALCHGRDGRGEGMLPLALKAYPNTNLATPRFGTDLKTVREIIRLSTEAYPISKEMPPWKDELSAEEIEAVAMFVQLLRDDLGKAMELIQAHQDSIERPSLATGRIIYQARCSLCHGESGKGDGRMAALIKNPPPFNLTLSRAPDDYLRRIILEGGAAVGRSPRMPPWKTDLSNRDVESLILYLKSIRTE